MDTTKQPPTIHTRIGPRPDLRLAEAACDLALRALSPAPPRPRDYSLGAEVGCGLPLADFAPRGERRGVLCPTR